MSILQNIGQYIVSTRKEKGFSQEQLALRSEMSVSYLRTIEHRTANPTILTLVRIASTLDVPLNNILPVDKEDNSYE